MEEKRVCPVCGAVTETPDDPRCGVCGYESAFVRFFSTPEAEAAWRAEAERRAAERASAVKIVPPAEKPVKPAEKPVKPEEKSGGAEKAGSTFSRTLAELRRTAPAVKSPRTTKKEEDNIRSIRAFTIWKDRSGSWLPEDRRRRIHISRINGNEAEYWEEGHRWTPVTIPVSELEEISDYATDSCFWDDKARRMRLEYEGYRREERRLAEERAEAERKREKELLEGWLQADLLGAADTVDLILDTAYPESEGRTHEIFQRTVAEANRMREWVAKAELAGEDEWARSHFIGMREHVHCSDSDLNVTVPYYFQLYHRVHAEINRRLAWIRNNGPSDSDMPFLSRFSCDLSDDPSLINEVYEDMQRELEQKRTWILANNPARKDRRRLEEENVSLITVREIYDRMGGQNTASGNSVFRKIFRLN